jgi:hypothetical protein
MGNVHRRKSMTVRPALKAISTPVGFPTGRALLPILVVSTRDMMKGSAGLPEIPLPLRTFNMMTLMNKIDVTSLTSVAIKVPPSSRIPIRRNGLSTNGLMMMVTSQLKTSSLLKKTNDDHHPHEKQDQFQMGERNRVIDIKHPEGKKKGNSDEGKCIPERPVEQGLCDEGSEYQGRAA